MISISTDSLQIYELLEKSGNFIAGFSRDNVLMFDFEDSCYVVMYVTSANKFVSFQAENCGKLKNTLISLIEAVQDHSDPSISPSLRDEAIRLIENKLHLNNDHFFFDAH
jgi:hypothetical protein